MLTSRLRRNISWGGVMALGLVAGEVRAQDGSPAGPPVTNPRTNQTGVPDTTAPKKTTGTTADDLPGVPATRRDPAPPGTRSVRVDVPASPGAATAPKAAPAARGQVFTAEGVVTRIDRAGKSINGELERFAFDPSQDWASYADRGAQGVSEGDAERPKTTEQQKDANAKQHADTPDKPKVMEMAITKRTYTYTFARNADGIDQYGAATSSSPDTTNSRSGLTNRDPGTTPASTGPMATNFTNMKEGSFVSVRYRKVGDLNEVLNLTLIELPLNPGGDVRNSGTGGPGTGSGTTGTGTGSGTGRTTPSVPATGRVPSVPLEPTGPGGSPK